MAEHPFRSNVLLWRVFRRELEETGVSLTCSPATIHGPRTTTGVLSSPKLLGGLTGNTDATGSPKQPHSVNPHRGAARRNHPPSRRHGNFHRPRRGEAAPTAARAYVVSAPEMSAAALSTAISRVSPVNRF